MKIGKLMRINIKENPFQMLENVELNPRDMYGLGTRFLHH